MMTANIVRKSVSEVTLPLQQTRRTLCLDDCSVAHRSAPSNVLPLSTLSDVP